MSAIRKALSSIYYTASGRTEVLHEVERLDRLYRSGRREIESLARSRLATTLAHASSTVPYFRDLLRGRLVNESTAYEVLADLPILTKNIIRTQRSSLISETPGSNPRENTSGGSTGEPVRLLQDREWARESRSGELLFMRWAGHELGLPHVLIWGVPQATFGERIPLRERIFRFAQNETYLNCYLITPDLMDGWIAALNRIKPSLIEAYVDALTELARRIVATGQKIHSPRGIIVSAGVLTPAARELFQKVFGCPILNRYGSREVSNVACSCREETALHVHEGWSHLEIVDEDGTPCPPGEEGNILVTVFANRTMPLIRYRIEDRGIWAEGECSCGRKTKRLAAVSGRRNDYLVAADGGHVNGTALTTLLYKVSGIRRFQYRQTSRSSVTLAVVALDPKQQTAVAESLAIPMNRLREMFEGMNVELKFEDDIAPSKSGKYRYILNQVGEETSTREPALSS